MVRTVVLAAGASSRMGRCKAALPLSHPADTFLSRILHTCISAGLPEILVVTGADPDGVRGAWTEEDPRVEFVHNPDWQRGQLSSLLAGLERPSAVPLEAAVVALVDAPLASPATVTALLDAWRRTRAPIVRPARGDEHGHPVLFDASIFDELRRADPAAGAKPVVRAHEREILNLAVDDPGAFVDLDTPEEYERVTRALRTR
jgi:molybdenum cofactor cytidylyltransferase